MRDIFAACAAFFQGLAQASTALLEFVLAVVEFNFQIVSGVFFAVARACDALGALVAALTAGAWEILLYIWAFLQHFAVAIEKCGVAIGHILLGMKHILLYITESLVFLLQCIQSGLICVFTGVAKLVILPWYLLCLFYGSIRTSFTDAWSITYNAAEILCTGISNSVDNVVKSSVHHIQTTFYYTTDCFMCIAAGIHTAFISAKKSTLKCCSLVYMNTPGEIYLYAVMFVICACAINWILNYLHQRGLTLPFIQYNSHPQYRRRGAGEQEEEDLFSDNSDMEGEYDLEEMSVYSNTGSDADQDSSSDILDDEVEEYEVVSDSETDSAIDQDEEEQVEIIDIQLPKRSGGYNLRRNRPSPPPQDKLTPDELERVLGNERERRTCVVCQDQVKTVLVLPCRHMCLCVECAHEITAQRNASRRICPLCRARMQTVMNIYV